MEAYFPDYLHKLTMPVTNDSMYFLEPKTFSNYGTIICLFCLVVYLTLIVDTV